MFLYLKRTVNYLFLYISPPFVTGLNIRIKEAQSFWSFYVLNMDLSIPRSKILYRSHIVKISVFFQSKQAGKMVTLPGTDLRFPRLVRLLAQAPRVP